MPDKQQQDWTADEQFWNEAWADMQQQLDVHLPRRKRRAAYWYWWLGGLLLLLLVLSRVVPAYFGGSAPVEDHNQSTLPMSFPQVEAEEKAETVFDAPILATQTEEAEPTLIESPTLEATKENTAPKLVEKQVAAASRDQVMAQLTNEQVAVDQQESTPLQMDQSLVLTEQFGPVSVLPRHGFQAVSQAEAAQNIPTANSALSTPAFKSQHPLQFFAHLGVTQSLHPGGGAYGGLGIERQIGEKTSLAIDLSYRYQQERIGYRSENAVNADEQEIVAPPGSTAENLDNLLAPQVQGGNAYAISQALRLGLNYRRQLGQKWTVSGGLGVNYLLSVGLTPSLNALGGFSSVAADFNNLFSSSIATANVNPAGRNLVAESLDLRRWRYDVQLKIGYQLGRRWTLEAGTTTYLSPIFGNTYQTTPWRGDVGVRYRF